MNHICLSLLLCKVIYLQAPGNQILTSLGESCQHTLLPFLKQICKQPEVSKNDSFMLPNMAYFHLVLLLIYSFFFQI